jgi:hypothetical protein
MMNEAGEPDELAIIGAEAADHQTSAPRVEPIDLSPMTFSRVAWAGRSLSIEPPLTLTPTMDEKSRQFYILECHDLNIDVFARTRDDLHNELAEQLVFQWDAYALESPDRLSRGARQLREALLARVREVKLATPSERR